MNIDLETTANDSGGSSIAEAPLYVAGSPSQHQHRNTDGGRGPLNPQYRCPIPITSFPGCPSSASLSSYPCRCASTLTGMHSAGVAMSIQPLTRSRRMANFLKDIRAVLDPSQCYVAVVAWSWLCLPAWLLRRCTAMRVRLSEADYIAECLACWLHRQWSPKQRHLLLILVQWVQAGSFHHSSCCTHSRLLPAIRHH
jgi:hypothetical protein